MKKPTNEELERAAVAAETGEWTKEHTCSNMYKDIKGNPWPGQCLVSLADEESKDSNYNGVKWLDKNLPKPFGGLGGEETGNFRYTEAIDNGKGKEVAAAIRSLI